MILRKVLNYEKIEEGYVFHGDCADMLLVFMSNDVIRVRVNFSRTFRERSFALVTTAWKDELDDILANERTRIVPLHPPVCEQEDYYQLETENLILRIRKSPAGVELLDKEGNPLHRDLPGRSYEKDHLGRFSHYSAFNFAHDHFYGFGETMGPLDKREHRLRLSPKDAIGMDPEIGGPLYKHIPFYTKMNDETGRALGLFYNNSYDCVFDMGNELSGYWERYSYYQTEGGDIDLFLINGPRMADVIERYTWLTGRTALTAKKALGFSMTTMYYCELEENCDDEILAVMDEYKRQDLPIDNFWMGSGYSSGEADNKRYVFNWNYKRFPDPEGFFRRMEDRQICTVPNLKPGILTTHPFMEDFKANDVFIKTPDGKDNYGGSWWGGTGYFFDFLKESGRKTWQKYLIANILKKGSGGIWNDNCEYDGVEDREAVCGEGALAGTMAEMKIIQSNMMGYTAKETSLMVFPEERPYVISRAGYAGIQRYAQVWDGDNRSDWKSLKYNTATILGMGISGVTNTGQDIGGFTWGAPEGELLLRWIQAGVFMPRYCMNSANNDNTVTQPWMYEENVPYIRQALRLRYRLIPYMYSLLKKANENGTPITRPLVYEFPNDPQCYSDEWMTFILGDSILVASVMEKGAKERTLYLPAGCTWYDLNDHLKAYPGGQTISAEVDLSTIPMFLRGGSVFYLGEDTGKPIGDSEKSLPDNLFYLISAEKDCRSFYYEDDGHSLDYQKGMYAATDIQVIAGEKTDIIFSRSGDYPSALKKAEIAFISKEKGALFVAADGKTLKRYLIGHQYQEAEEGWYYDLSTRAIMVKYHVPDKKEYTVTISTKYFDLIGM